jgi:hypothetical protein
MDDTCATADLTGAVVVVIAALIAAVGIAWSPIGMAGVPVIVLIIVVMTYLAIAIYRLSAMAGYVEILRAAARF